MPHNNFLPVLDLRERTAQIEKRMVKDTAEIEAQQKALAARMLRLTKDHLLSDLEVSILCIYCYKERMLSIFTSKAVQLRQGAPDTRKQDASIERPN